MLANSEQYLVIEYNKLNFANLSYFNMLLSVTLVLC